MRQKFKQTNRRTVIKSSMGVVLASGLLGLGVYTSTRPAVALETDGQITADDVALANNEQQITNFTLQPSFELTYENFSGGVDQIDFRITVNEVIANVADGFNYNADTIVMDWDKNSNSANYVTYGSNGDVISKANHSIGTTTPVDLTNGNSVEFSTAQFTPDTTGGSNVSASFGQSMSIISNIEGLTVADFPGGGSSTNIMDNEAGASKVTLEYAVVFRDTDNNTNKQDTETVEFYVVLDNPPADIDVTGSSGVNATGK